MTTKKSNSFDPNDPRERIRRLGLYGQDLRLAPG